MKGEEVGCSMWSMMRAGDEIWRRGRGGEDLQLASLLPWLVCNLLSFNEFLILFL